MSVHQQIMKQIDQAKAGEILFPADFRGAGTDSAIKMSLSRIAGKGNISRLSHGIYLKPKSGSKKNAVIPMPEEIAMAIAERESIRIMASGDYALYQLGFTNDKPTILTYVTDGEPRKIQIGDKTIIFKATTPKKLSMKGAVSSLIIQSLEVIGKENLTIDYERKIKAEMLKEDPKKLVEDLMKAPAWIYNLLIKLKTDSN
jgi:hypothetical protein